MKLLSLADILRPTMSGHWAVGAYDAPNIHVLLGILDAAEEDQAPTIILVYPGMTPSNLFSSYVAFLRAEVHRRKLPVAIVLDHGTKLETIVAAIDAGFTGVMIDASSQPFSDNIAITKKVVALARAANISIEAELGSIGSGEDDLSIDDRIKLYTRVDDAKTFVEETKIDALAIAIGSTHGLYRFEPKFDLVRAAEIMNAVKIPLVLHGSSGSPKKEIFGSIAAGIKKINVYTDIRVKVIARCAEFLESNHILKVDICDLDRITQQETKKVVQEKNRLFGAVGKAGQYI